MAAFGRSLCLILTLWMAGSSPTVIPPRSSDSSPWWDQASLKIQQNALRLRKAGDFRAAAALYQEGYGEAVRRRDRLAAVRYLMSAGGCELMAFEYREALARFLQARDLATAAEDHADLGAIAVNLSSLYLEMWDLPSATRAAEDGLHHAALLEAGNVPGGKILLSGDRLFPPFASGQLSCRVATIKWFWTRHRASGSNGRAEAAQCGDSGPTPTVEVVEGLTKENRD